MQLPTGPARRTAPHPVIRLLPWVPGAAIAILALFPPAAFAARTDVVVFRNGDRITGEVKKLAGGRLEFKTDKAATLQVDWDAVAQLTSGLFFEITLDDARRLYGALLPPTSDGTLRVGTDDQAVEAPLGRIVGIARLRSTVWSRIDGSVDLGLSYTGADSKTELDLGAQTFYRTPKRKISLSLDSTFRRSSSEDFDREDLTAAFQRFWGGRWLSVAFASWQRNSELALSGRLIAGGGAGLHLLRTVEHDLVLQGGVDVSNETFTDERPSTQSLEALVGLNYNLYALGGREFKVTAAFTLFPSLSVKGRVRAESSLDLRKELFRSFFLNVSFFDSFDNRAEAGATKNDFGTTTSFGWSF